jgi:hypothetical protein
VTANWGGKLMSIACRTIRRRLLLNGQTHEFVVLDWCTPAIALCVAQRNPSTPYSRLFVIAWANDGFSGLLFVMWCCGMLQIIWKSLMLE